MKFSVDEINAIEKSLPALGGYVTGQGLAEKSFNDMTRDEILGLVANTVRGFREAYNDIIGDIPF